MYIPYEYIKIKSYGLFEKQEMSKSFSSVYEKVILPAISHVTKILLRGCTAYVYTHMIFVKCKRVITRLPDKHQLVKSCDTRWWDTGRMIGATYGVYMQRRSRSRDRWTCSPPVSVTWCTKDNLIHKSWYAKRVRRECISSVGLKSTTSRMAPL